ncbi:MAG TPA: PQQ-binding-like beta-propeller repeat protein [Longimicrobium sp.]|jgi:outer membrane protein assembly factor BamB
MRVGGAVQTLKWAAVLGTAACSPATTPGDEEKTGPGAPPGTEWRVAGQGWGTPSVDPATVFFTGRAHEVVAVDRARGTVRWRASTGQATASTAGFNTVVAGDVVVVPDIALYGFDRQTGALRWRFAPEGGSPGAANLASDGETVYAGSLEGRVYAVDARTGAARWTVELGRGEGVAAFDPTIADGTVYVGIKRLTIPNTGALVALDAATGAVRWSREFTSDDPRLGTGCFGGAVVYGGLVIVSIQDGTVAALDRGTGAVRWRASRLSNLPLGAGGSPDSDMRPLVLAGEAVVAGSTTGVVTALDAATGAERWRAFANRGSAVYPLAVDGERVYVNHFAGQLAAFSLHDGALLWLAGDNRNGFGDFVNAPRVDGEHVYLSGHGGYHALRTE